MNDKLNEAAEKYCLNTQQVEMNNGIVGEPFESIFNAFIAGAQFKAQSTNNCGGVWIRAIERLPKKFKTVIVRNIHTGKVAVLANMTHSSGWNTGMENDFAYFDTEWLDESQPQPITDENSK